MIKAAIFDMDGLLIDSEPFWRQSHREVLSKHGVTITDDELRAVMGKTTLEVVRIWHEEYSIENTSYDETMAAIVAKVIDHIQVNGQELPGVRKIIQILQQHNIPMAVASSSLPEIIEVVLNKLGLTPYFHFAYSATNEEFGKPHPGVFLTTAKKLGIKPQECIVFEDSLNGVRAAKAAGMKCIAVPDKESQKKPEFKAEADAVVASLEDVSWETITDLY